MAVQQVSERPPEVVEKLKALDKDIETFKNKRDAMSMEEEYAVLMTSVSRTTRYISDQRLDKGMADIIVAEIYEKCRKARSHRMVAEIGY